MRFSMHSRPAKARPGPVAVAAVLLAATGIPSISSADDDAEGWQFRLTPYLWLPTIEGNLRYSLPPATGGSPNIAVGPADWFDLLNFGALIGGSATKGRFSLFSDLVYLSLTSDEDDRVASVDDTITVPGTRIPVPVSANLNADTRTDLDGLLLTLAAGYSLLDSEEEALILFAGARYFDVDASTAWNLTVDISGPGPGGVLLPSQGSVGGGSQLWDGIVGVRGELGLGDGNWSLPYYLDIGGGDSDSTWNAMAGVARSYSWGDLLIAYRHLEYDQEDDSLIQDFSFGGPVIGARFRF